jgi:hypothetical protein
MAVAVRCADKFEVSPPEPVLDTKDLFDRLAKRRKEAGPLLIGFDFPIGVPATYGVKTGFPDFRTALMSFGKGAWSNWFSPGERPSDISIHRPFYPARPGKKGDAKLEHLISGLGLTGDQLASAGDADAWR